MITRQLPPDVAVVTHGGVINIVYHLVKGLPWTNKAPSFPTAATGIHEILYSDREWKITVENDTGHLCQA
jgi:probable phosphoglycerate mutase